MVIGAFQQNGVPEPVSHPQVNAYGCVHIGEQFFTPGCYGNFFICKNCFSGLLAVLVAGQREDFMGCFGLKAIPADR